MRITPYRIDRKAKVKPKKRKFKSCGHIIFFLLTPTLERVQGSKM